MIHQRFYFKGKNYEYFCKIYKTVDAFKKMFIALDFKLHIKELHIKSNGKFKTRLKNIKFSDCISYDKCDEYDIRKCIHSHFGYHLDLDFDTYEAFNYLSRFNDILIDGL